MLPTDTAPAGGPELPLKTPAGVRLAKVLQGQESAIAAETRVEALLESVQDRLHLLNARALDLRVQLEVSQRGAGWAVMLQMHDCGPGCMGCPHPRWKKYQWTEATGTRPALLKSYSISGQARDPVLALQRSAPNYVQTVGLIREAKDVLARRTVLLTSLINLRKALTHSKIPS